MARRRAALHHCGEERPVASARDGQDLLVSDGEADGDRGG
jgi:hypothetical protein